MIDGEASQSDVRYYCETTRSKTGMFTDGNKVDRAFAEAVFPQLALTKKYK